MDTNSVVTVGIDKLYSQKPRNMKKSLEPKIKLGKARNIIKDLEKRFKVVSER